MDFESCLRNHIATHPYVMPQDLVKFCYQAALGAEHLMVDIVLAERNFYDEYGAVESDDSQPLMEPLSEEFVRVNFAKYKSLGLDPDELFVAFVSSVTKREDSDLLLVKYLSISEKIIGMGVCDIDAEQWNTYLEEYENGGRKPVHHSAQYRDRANPSYRVVASKYVKWNEAEG